MGLYRAKIVDKAGPKDGAEDIEMVANTAKSVRVSEIQSLIARADELSQSASWWNCSEPWFYCDSRTLSLFHYSHGIATSKAAI